MPCTRDEEAHSRCLAAGERPPQHCFSSPSCLAHTDPVCYTRVPDSWKQEACGTPHKVKGDTVAGGPPGRNERLSIVEVGA
jgi:hypothetical protein